MCVLVQGVFAAVIGASTWLRRDEQRAQHVLRHRRFAGKILRTVFA